MHRQTSKKLELVTIILMMFFASLSMIVGLLWIKNLFISCFLYHILSALFIPFLVMYLSKSGTGETISLLGLKKDLIKETTFIGIIHGVFFFIFMLLGYLLFGELVAENSIEVVLSQWKINSDNKFIFFLVFTIINGVIEEIYWRGYLLGRLEKLVDSKVAILLTTFFYVSYHAVPLSLFFGVNITAVSMLAGVSFAGFVWGWMRIRYGSVWPSVIGHTFATFGYVLLYFLM